MQRQVNKIKADQKAGQYVPPDDQHQISERRQLKELIGDLYRYRRHCKMSDPCYRSYGSAQSSTRGSSSQVAVDQTVQGRPS